MNGPGYLLDLAKTALERTVPVVLDRRDRASTIPRPQLYSIGDRPRLEGDEWPAVLVVGQDMLRQKRVDTAPADPTTGAPAGVVYRRTYRMRTYVFARGDSYEQTNVRRYALILAVAEAFMLDVTLGDPNCTIDENSFRESYSDIDTAARSKRSIAAAWLECDATLQEVLTIPDLGEADLIEVELHPALQ